MTTHHRTTAVLLLPLYLLALAGCEIGGAEQAPSSGAPGALPEVTVAETSFRTVRDWSDFSGRIEAVERVDVRARVSGYIEAVQFREGSEVEAGDLLFQIDPRPLQAEVERLGAELGRAGIELDLARTLRDRSERLLAQNATSAEEHEQLAAEAEVAAANLRALKASLETAELDLSFTSVTAPISGSISRAEKTAGNLVDNTTVLTTLVSENPVYVYFDIDEHAYLELLARRSEQKGASVLVGLINEDGYPHSAELDFVDNRVNPATGTIRARATLDNADGLFRPGLFARLRLISNHHYRTALVEDRAIGTDLGRKFVFVVDEDNMIEYRAVETGRLVDGLRIVTNGLTPQDLVVVNGVQRVRPGATVATAKVAMGGEALSDPESPGAAPRERHDARLARTGATTDIQRETP